MRIRTLVKDTLIYGSGTVLLRATAFLTVPVYTRFFSPSDYGIWNFVTTTVWLLNGFLILGGDSALAWLYFQAKDDREKRVLTSTLLTFLGAWGFGIVIVLLPLAGVFSKWSFGTGSYTTMFQIALVAAPFVLANAMASQALRNMFRAGVASLLNIAAAIVELSASFYFLLVQHSGIRAPLLGVLVGAAVFLPVRLWLIRPLLCRAFSWEVLVKALRFGVPLVPASVSMWVLLASDRIVLAKLASPAELGLYSVALGVASLLMLADSAFGQAWFPYAAQLHKQDPQTSPVIFGLVLKYLLTSFGFAALLLTLFAHQMLVLLTQPRFYSAALAVGPLALGALGLAASRITSLGIVLSGRSAYVTIVLSLAGALNVALNFALVPRWGFVGSAWATAVTYACVAVGQLGLSQRLFPVVTTEWRRIWTIVVVTVLSITAASLLERHSPPHGLVLRVGLLLAFPTILLLSNVVDQRERALSMDMLRRAGAALSLKRH